MASSIASPLPNPAQNPPWLTIVGIGESGLDGLSNEAQEAIAQAQWMMGGDRHLALAASAIQASATVQPWSSPIAASIDQLLSHRGQPVCVLASGDPLCYGIATTLLRKIPRSEMTIIPTLSAFTLAVARLGWAFETVEKLSLCGRDPLHLRPALYPNAKILILCADRTTPHTVARVLQDWGYEEVQMTLLDRLGGPEEQQRRYRVADWHDQIICSDLCMIALQCPMSVDLISALRYSRLPGLPDQAYRHDGQLTKQEIRIQTLAALAPYPGALLWDVGAGCGSIGIEWMRTHPRCQAIAIESHPDRIAYIRQNAQTLGVPALQIAEGSAPEILQNLMDPDVIFIGGGLTRSGVFEACWEALPVGGRMVANGVTIETEQKLFDLHQRYGGALTRFQVQRTDAIGRFRGWSSLSPITQWRTQKVAI